MHLLPSLLIATLMLSLTLAPASAAEVSAAGQTQARTGADTSSEPARCAKLKGKRHASCVKQAKDSAGVEQETQASTQHVDASATKVDAQYDLDKLRCADMAGSSKQTCLQQAQAKHEKSKDAVEQGQPDATASEAGERPKQEASYELARKQCEKLEGAQKEGCLGDAKQRYLK